MLKLSRGQFVGYDDKTSLGEIQFFFCTKTGEEELPFALISLFTAPDATLLAQSHGTLWSCRYQGEAELRVIPAKSIISVVAMVPHKGDHFFLAEKPGLEVAWLGGVEEELTEE